MKKLVLAEKPSVAKDLARILGATQKNRAYYEGKEYIVTWAYGHLLTLKMPEDLKPEWRQWELAALPMIPEKFGIKPLPKTTGQLKAIAALAKRGDVDGGIIATDAGRAGELLARWIFEWVRFKKPLQRLWISSQTDQAVKNGFRQLQSAKKYDTLYASELARTQADWLVGLNVTRALTTKYGDNLSAGRVQTPTLQFVMETQEKIESFLPQTYYVIEGEVNGQKAVLDQRFDTPERAQAFINQHLAQVGGQVQATKTKTKSVPAPLPYDLTELQQAANAKYGFSAKQTLSLVQSLYETHKVVSYPRTDSKYLPQDIKNTLKDRLNAVAAFDSRAKQIAGRGAQVTVKSVFNDAKVTDHYALIPTEERPLVARFSQDELRIYRMITERFIGLFLPPYQTEKTTVTVDFAGISLNFSQEQVVALGWKPEEVTSSSRPTQDWSSLRKVKGDFHPAKRLTSPPKALTEGTLLAKMEQYELGTPATRAEIIEKLIRSEAMERTGNALRVTPKGKQLLSLVNPALVSPKLTSKWEKDLEQIAKGALKPQAFIKEIEAETRKLVAEIKASQADYRDFALTTKKCPDCGSPLREKSTKDGKIYVCSNTDCNYRRRKDPKVSNHRCNQCHKKMVIIDGKNGSYFKCLTCGTTEKMTGKAGGKNKKMSKHEERKLLQKVNQESEPVESPLAAALRAAMKE